MSKDGDLGELPAVGSVGEGSLVISMVSLGGLLFSLSAAIAIEQTRWRCQREFVQAQARPRGRREKVGARQFWSSRVNGCDNNTVILKFRAGDE